VQGGLVGLAGARARVARGADEPPDAALEARAAGSAAGEGDVARLQALALRPGSHAVYGAVWRQYEAWRADRAPPPDRDGESGRCVVTCSDAQLFIAHYALNTRASLTPVLAALKYFGRVDWSTAEERETGQVLAGAKAQRAMSPLGQAAASKREMRDAVPKAMWQWLCSAQPASWSTRNYTKWMAMFGVAQGIICRPAEVLALRMGDVHKRDDGSYGIKLRAAKNDAHGRRHGHKEQQLAGKRGPSLLDAWMAERQRMVGASAVAPSADAFLFASEPSGLQAPSKHEFDTATTAAAQAARAAGVLAEGVKIRPHSWRITAVVRANEAGATNEQIQQLGRWKSASSVTNYLRAPEAAMRAAILDD